MPSSGRETDRLSIQDAKSLFRAGEFSEIIRRVKPSGLGADADPAMRVLVAHASVLSGDWNRANELVGTDAEDIAPLVRSRAFVVRGLVAHVTGALTAASQQFRIALRFAQDSKDVHQIAWASVYLLNHLVNVEPHEVVAA